MWFVHALERVYGSLYVAVKGNRGSKEAFVMFLNVKRAAYATIIREVCVNILLRPDVLVLQPCQIIKPSQ